VLYKDIQCIGNGKITLEPKGLLCNKYMFIIVIWVVHWRQG